MNTTNQHAGHSDNPIEGARYKGRTYDLTVREVDASGNVHVQVHNNPDHENMILDRAHWDRLVAIDDLLIVP